MADVVCPRCSCPTAPGRFCEHCGQRLADAAPAPSATQDASVPTAGAATPSASQADASAAIPPLSAMPTTPLPSSGTLPAIEPDPLPPLPATQPLPALQPLPDLPALQPLPALPALSALPPLPPLAAPPSLGSAPALAAPGPLAVECSLPERLVEGMAAALLFRLRSEGRDMKSVSLTLVEGDRTLAGPVQHQGVLGLRGAEIALNVRPSQSGCVAVELRVECQRAGVLEPESWAAPLTVLVEAASGTASSAAPVTINVNNSGDLAEISLGRLADRLRPSASPEDRLRAIANPRQFRPVEGLRLVTSPTRLTLSSNSGRIHLVARKPAWFGRQGERPEKGRVIDNAIVLRCMSPDGRTVDADASCQLSRTHFLVEPNISGGCRLRDGAPVRDERGNILPGGVATPSSGGLAVDGERLPPCGSATFTPADGEHVVVLAPGAREGGALALRLTALPDASGRTSGVLLRRSDSLPECYLLVWGETDLGCVADALRGMVVLWDGARFLLLSPDGLDRPLAPGLSFGSPTNPVRVETFRQLAL